MRVTRFMDMHSGGRCKEPPYEYIYIEALEDEAKIIFQNRFGHNPDRVTCTCCGEDYSIHESVSFAQASGYDRNCHYQQTGKKGKYTEENDHSEYAWNDKKYQTVKEYLKRPNVLLVRNKDIKPEERHGQLKKQGYVWVD